MSSSNMQKYSAMSETGRLEFKQTCQRSVLKLVKRLFQGERDIYHPPLVEKAYYHAAYVIQSGDYKNIKVIEDIFKTRNMRWYRDKSIQNVMVSFFGTFLIAEVDDYPEYNQLQREYKNINTECKLTVDWYWRYMTNSENVCCSKVRDWCDFRDRVMKNVCAKDLLRTHLICDFDIDNPISWMRGKFVSMKRFPFVLTTLKDAVRLVPDEDERQIASDYLREYQKTWSKP